MLASVALPVHRRWAKDFVTMCSPKQTKENEDVRSRKEETFLKGEIKATDMRIRQK